MLSAHRGPGGASVFPGLTVRCRRQALSVAYAVGRAVTGEGEGATGTEEGLLNPVLRGLIIGTIPERRSMGHSREKKGTGGNKQHGLWELLESALPGGWALGDVPDAGWRVGLGRWPWMPGPGAWTLS